MTDKYFTKTEADVLNGTRIRTMVEFSGVPQGTTGTVMGAAETGRDTAAVFMQPGKAGSEGYTVAIQWDLPGRDKPLVDWFSKADFERYLQTL
jgi:hypothetical protein